jgi:hypothetical protein
LLFAIRGILVNLDFARIDTIESDGFAAFLKKYLTPFVICTGLAVVEFIQLVGMAKMEQRTVSTFAMMAIRHFKLHGREVFTGIIILCKIKH